ncbi:hypothetical protein SAMN02745823_03108 [Sporobacter termitidis DSM 10068]|uniref:Winged helix DNA-binding domain-containing protein n=1 Tax=Sporobacter termitidis DSM 10068 TaxID=1123282 RepID=A0A1M5Z1R3_9FIRM|nr:crosslink repair DNA glycosylase YcaQ family protein [Sporobacter termitidis]SHI18160.1 hypothetical protein SAMN02745823_03108 [Sporobacter termitidis DSM 10068]
MKTYAFTVEQARRFMLAKQGLSGAHKFSGRQGVLDFIRQAGCVQYDPIDICGKNAELVLFSRVAGFTKELLNALLYEDRALVDYFDKNMAIIAAEDWKYFARTRRHNAEHGHSRELVEAVAGPVKELIRKRGFVCSRDVAALNAASAGIDCAGKVDWSWNPAPLSRAALETLYFRGELVLHHKKGTMKYYTLASDALGAGILSAADPNETEADFIRWMIARRVGAVGLLWNRPSDAWLGIGGLTAEKRNSAFSRLLEEDRLIACRVDGLSAPLYLQGEDEPLAREILEGGGGHGRLELLAPLDNMLWDRKLIKALFDFDYKWEIYTPVSQRRFGYYVLPVLYGGAFAGRIELEADRKAARLLVKNFWPEPGFQQSKRFDRQLAAQLQRFARFNGCAQAVKA